ncbi:rhodanese-related sulfurtransferase [bacterium]|nr:rhodanese-related sulfurtransferase [bacterium]
MLKYMHNMKEREELEQSLAAENFARIPASFYKYGKIENPQDFRNDLYKFWYPMRVFGRVYVSKEGINAQVSVPEFLWNEFVETVHYFPLLKKTMVNRSRDQGNDAFLKLDIKLREKIVADGIKGNLFDEVTPGEHLSPKDFHEKLERGDVVLIDTRNDYECETGHFEGAYCPESKTFSQVLPEIKTKFAKDKDKTVLMYCTGGIRCEKASAYMKKEGFNHVYQLKGGIINYLNTVEREGKDSKFKGSLFVFDGRMAEPTVNEVLSHCHQCDAAYDVHSDCANVKCHSLMIQCPSCAEKFSGCCSEQCQNIILGEKVHV